MVHKRLLILILTGGALALTWYSMRRGHDTTRSSHSPISNSSSRFASASEIEAQERKADATVWARELTAERCGRVFENWWDALNRATNKLELAASLPVGEIRFGEWKPPATLPHGIHLQKASPGGPSVSPAEWRRFIQALEQTGWQLVRTEFRHIQFDSDDAGNPHHSLFEFSAHLINAERNERASLSGNLSVDWTPVSGRPDKPAVKTIDASGLVLQTRKGNPGFRCVLDAAITPPPRSFFIDPLILYDLDQDGISEIILAARNLVYHRRPGPGIAYDPRPLCRFAPGLIFTGIIADFDGDGLADFLCAKFEGLVLFKGSAQGTFDEPGQQVWAAPRHLKYVTALTCGDVNHDGALDIFLGQYKLPYQGGAMPSPWYDANDGFPSYLLINDGQGHFQDATTSAGLGQKRWRRCYGASLVDLDGDQNLDLTVISDFAGLDVFRNNGHGSFTDVTSQWAPEAHGFGMGQAFADFNADGRLDFLMIGMPSPAADRLEHAGLWRSEKGPERSMRAKMTYGNRLYIAREKGGFEQTQLNASIARSGWAWGVAAADFDNDGFPDLYVANGHESKETVSDYDPEFWLHDIYVGDSSENSQVKEYFEKKFARTRGRGQSYGGHYENRFYLNLDAQSFLEIGHLMGVALEEDSRNVVADDLDGDGREDLLVTTFEVWPEIRQTLRVFKNEIEDTGNWIGFRFREQGGGRSPVGMQVKLRWDEKSAVREIVAGDSYRSQQANTVHFGLGNSKTVDSAEISWPNGKAQRLEHPGINRYYLIAAP